MFNVPIPTYVRYMIRYLPMNAERERERSREKMISFQKGADGKIPDNAHIILILRLA